MTLLTISAGSNENRTSGNSWPSFSRSWRLRSSTRTPLSSFERDADQGFFRASGPLVDGVDGVA